MLINVGGQSITYGGSEIEYGALSDPIAGNITDVGFNIVAIPYVDGVCAIVITDSSVIVAPSDPAFDASTERVNITANAQFTISHAGASSGTPYRIWVQIKNGDVRTTTSVFVTTELAILAGIIFLMTVF